MRVLFDSQVFQMQRNGGVSRYFVQLIKSLTALQLIEAEVTMGLHISELADDLRRVARVRGLSLRMPDWPRTLRVRGEMNRFLTKHVLSSGGVDIFHPTYYRVDGLAPRHERRVVRTVLTVYDLIHEKLPFLMSPRDQTARWRRVALERADAVLTISETTRNDLLEYYRIDPERIWVTPPANSLVLPKRQASVSMRKPYLLFVGERRRYKNFEVLVEALRRDAEFRREFDVVCFGTTPLKSNASERLPISYAAGTDADLAGLYLNAFAFILPSRYEGFGLPLLEAMHCRCPVITTRAGALPEVAGDAALYFDPDSWEDLVACVNRLKDADVRSGLVELGVIREASFSWERCARQTFEAYSRALEV